MRKLKPMTREEFQNFAAQVLAQAETPGAQIYFGSGDLSFYRPKNRGPKEGPAMVFIEFNEAYNVTADPFDD